MAVLGTWQRLAHHTDTVSGKLDTFCRCCSQSFSAFYILLRLAEAGTMVLMVIADSLQALFKELSLSTSQGLGTYGMFSDPADGHCGPEA